MMMLAINKEASLMTLTAWMSCIVTKDDDDAEKEFGYEARGSSKKEQDKRGAARDWWP